jgi:hypothetical protein
MIVSRSLLVAIGFKGGLMAAKTTKPPKCKACGVLLESHDGQEKLCRKLERARTTLQIIRTWADFELAFNRHDVVDLIEEVLKVIK